MENSMVVQGFMIDSFTVKGDVISITLKGEKEEIRAGSFDLGDVLKSLELHITTGEDVPVRCSLLRSSIELTTYSYPFTVRSYVVKQDDIKLKIEATAIQDIPLSDVSKSLTIHAQEEKQLELTLSEI